MKKNIFGLVLFSLAFFSCNKESNDISSCFTYIKSEVYEVNFNSSCSKGAGSYQWEFGDGNSSINPNPTHTYLLPGKYEVTLVVTGEEGSSNTSTQVVDIINDVKSCFTYERDYSEVTFNSSCSENANIFYWFFGDGNVSTEPNPTNEYASSEQTYNVTLVTLNSNGASDTSEQVIIYACKTCSSGDTVQNILYSSCGSAEELSDFCPNCLTSGGTSCN